METAYTSQYFFIEAKEVNPLKKSQYFCPYCNGKLTFVAAGKYVAHFKHAIGTPKEQTEICELFMKGKKSASLFDEEWRAKYKLRLVLKKQGDQFGFYLKLPIHHRLVRNKFMLKEFPTREFKTSILQKENIEIQLQKNYTIEGLESKTETYRPFINGPLIFKEIKGEFVSIDYRKVHLTGRFYIVTPTPLVEISRELEFIKRYEQFNFFIYECRMPTVVKNSFEQWLYKVVHYTFVPAKAYIDLLEPLDFKKTSNVYEVYEQQTTWLVTNVKEKRAYQRLVVVHPDGSRKEYEIVDGIVQINIKKQGDYFLYLNNTESEFITVRYAEKMNFQTKFFGKFMINDEDYLFNRNHIIGNSFEITTNLNGYIYKGTRKQLNLQTVEKLNAPAKITIPKIWTFQLESPPKHQKSIDWDELFCIYEQHYRYKKEVVQKSTIQFLEQQVIDSTFPKKTQLIYYIRKLAVCIPSEVAAILKEYI